MSPTMVRATAWHSFRIPYLHGSLNRTCPVASLPHIAWAHSARIDIIPYLAWTLHNSFVPPLVTARHGRCFYRDKVGEEKNNGL